MRRAIASLSGIAVLLAVGAAEAHHFKGLPHFSYYKNYPQVPQEEFIGRAGDLEFSLVTYDFQGLDRSETEQPDDVRLFVVLFNLRENRVYQGPLTLQIFDGEAVIYEVSFDTSQEESVYSLQRKLPDTGRYALGIRLDDGSGISARVDFKLSSQKIMWGRWVAALLAAVVVLVAIGSRRARIVMERRDAARASHRRSHSAEEGAAQLGN